MRQADDRSPSLSHMSGLTYGFMLRTNVDAAYRKLGLGERKGTLREMVEAMAEIPLEFSPGERWNYSMATDVCAIWWRFSRANLFDQFLQERIFDRLGMVDTGFHVPDDKVHRFAANYQRGADKTLGLLDDPQESPYRKPARFLSGGGGWSRPPMTTSASVRCSWLGASSPASESLAENPRADDQQPPTPMASSSPTSQRAPSARSLTKARALAWASRRTRPGSCRRWGLAGRVGLGEEQRQRHSGSIRVRTSP